MAAWSFTAWAPTRWAHWAKSLVGPCIMSIDIIAGIVWGFVGGEWKGASRAALGYCLTGIAILFLAIGVISLGSAS